MLCLIIAVFLPFLLKKKPIKSFHRCPKFLPCSCDEDPLLCSQSEATSCRRSIHRHVEHHQLLRIRREGEGISQVEKKSHSPVSQCPALLSICFNSQHTILPVYRFSFSCQLHTSHNITLLDTSEQMTKLYSAL